MLLNLTVDNWMSYRDEATLALTSSLERQHMDTLAKLPGFRSRKALPVAAVYGGNASGKTGIFRAVAALKRMVTVDPGVDGVVPVAPFMLEAGSDDRPTLLDCTFLAGETVYRLVVEATLDGVVYESLETLTERGSTDVYERDIQAGKFDYSRAFFCESDHVGYAAKATRKNQLFLQAAVAQNVAELREAYAWFDETLQLVGVESQAWSFATAADGHDEGFMVYASDALARMDTGIVRLTGESVGMAALPEDGQLRRDVAALQDGEVLTLVADRAAGDYGFEMLTVRKREGSDVPEVERLRTVHEGPDGREHLFSLSMESSGTQRLLGLLPMLFDLKGGTGKVYVVDELDRCLHTMLTRRLVEDFLATCGPNTRKQLLFTTHDLLLMDQSLMRRDEMFVSQRGTDGCSELVGISEFKDVRFDKDLIRSYLDGRFGGIPMLGRGAARG